MDTPTLSRISLQLEVQFQQSVAMKRLSKRKDLEQAWLRIFNLPLAGVQFFAASWSRMLPRKFLTRVH
jgi:hypothetical protein